MGTVSLVGQRLGRLMALYESRKIIIKSPRGVRVYAQWMCRCDCGTFTEVRGENLKSGGTSSCGCKKNILGERSTTHGLTETPEYRIWTGILTRCRNPRAKAFRLSGGRGISVCARWADFSAFLLDMGNRPSRQHSIDRVNNDGNYEPGNCRWATRKEQSNNQSRNVRLTFNGKVMTISQWSEEIGIDPKTLWQRHRAGWEPSRSLSQP